MWSSVTPANGTCKSTTLGVCRPVVVKNHDGRGVAGAGAGGPVQTPWRGSEFKHQTRFCKIAQEHIIAVNLALQECSMTGSSCMHATRMWTNTAVASQPNHFAVQFSG
jgi:hypothetical protein